ncbi:MAG: DUF2975 domain-containing protein [Candidatus Moranbacteria bacterium]|nr:DUF2975 domain-containing protein [Candidatus Moranbacteria bacterium]
MKRGSIIFLKLIIAFVGIGALALMVKFPQTEGRAANLDLIGIYTDPFIIYIYVASIPFFTALYQASKLLGYIGRNEAFSQASVRALRNIKYCALMIVGFIAGAEAYIIISKDGSDDIAGGVAMGIFIGFASVVIAIAAAVFEKLLQNAVDIKSENDLTV